MPTYQRKVNTTDAFQLRKDILLPLDVDRWGRPKLVSCAAGDYLTYDANDDLIVVPKAQFEADHHPDPLRPDELEDDVYALPGVPAYGVYGRHNTRPRRTPDGEIHLTATYPEMQI